MAINKNKRIKVYEKFGGKCAYCGEDIHYDEMCIDHIISKRDFEVTIKYAKKPVSEAFRTPDFLVHLTVDDVDHIDNLFPCCRTCNSWKKSYSIETFRRQLEEQVKKLNKYSTNYRIAKKYYQVIETVRPIVFYFEHLKKRA